MSGLFLQDLLVEAISFTCNAKKKTISYKLTQARSSDFVDCKKYQRISHHRTGKYPYMQIKMSKKQIRSLVQKVDLTEQNQCDFWIQHIKIILNQLKKNNKKTETINLLLTSVISLFSLCGK